MRNLRLCNKFSCIICAILCEVKRQQRGKIMICILCKPRKMNCSLNTLLIKLTSFFHSTTRTFHKLKIFLVTEQRKKCLINNSWRFVLVSSCEFCARLWFIVFYLRKSYLQTKWGCSKNFK